MNFPIIKRFYAQTISDKLLSVSPMSLETAAAGREIKPYPQKYDTFNSLEDLKNYIELMLHEDQTLKPEWLSQGKVLTSPLISRDDIYYTATESFQITCYKPAEHVMQDIIYGKVICTLKLDDPIALRAGEVLEHFKKKKDE